MVLNSLPSRPTQSITSLSHQYNENYIFGYNTQNKTTYWTCVSTLRGLEAGVGNRRLLT